MGSLSLAPAFATAHEVTSNDSIGLQNRSSGLPRRVTPRNDEVLQNGSSRLPHSLYYKPFNHSQ